MSESIVMSWKVTQGPEFVDPEFRNQHPVDVDLSPGTPGNRRLPVKAVLKDEDVLCLCGHPRWLHERRLTPHEYEDCPCAWM